MEARLRRHLGHAGAADPVVGDRAGRGPVRRPRGRQRGTRSEEDADVRPARRRRRRDDRARRGRRRSTMPIEAVLALKEGDLLRLNAPAAGGITLFADKVPVHTGPPGPQRQPPRRAGHGPRGRSVDERHRRPEPARPVDRRGLPRRARDVRRRARSRSARSRRSSDSKAGVRRRARARRVAMSVSYVDGVTGGNVFLITLDGARMLAASMMGMDEPGGPGRDRALRARALRGLGGDEPDDGLGRRRDVASCSAPRSRSARPRPRPSRPPTTIADAYPHDAARRARSRCRSAASPRGSSSSSRTRSSCACRARSTISAPSFGAVPDAGAPRPAGSHRRAAVAGRASRCACGPSSAARACPPRRSSGCPTGAVVELDKQADDAIDLFVNGTHFATGRLVVVDGTDWAVRIEHVLDTNEINTDSGMEVARWPESW